MGWMNQTEAHFKTSSYRIVVVAPRCVGAGEGSLSFDLWPMTLYVSQSRLMAVAQHLVLAVECGASDQQGMLPLPGQITWTATSEKWALLVFQDAFWILSRVWIDGGGGGRDLAEGGGPTWALVGHTEVSTGWSPSYPSASWPPDWGSS